MDNELELLVTKYLDRNIKELFKLLILKDHRRWISMKYQSSNQLKLMPLKQKYQLLSFTNLFFLSFW